MYMHYPAIFSSVECYCHDGIIIDCSGSLDSCRRLGITWANYDAFVTSQKKQFLGAYRTLFVFIRSLRV